MNESRYFFNDSSLQHSQNASETFTYEQYEIMRTAAIIAYSTIFFLGITGNTGIIFIIYRYGKRRTKLNMLVANLAWSDICTCTVPNIFTPLNIFMPSWEFGETLCKLLPTVSSVSIFVSTLTSTVIAIDRYFAVHKLHRKVFTHSYRNLLLTICVIWSVSVMFSLPIANFSKINDYEKCTEEWPAHLQLAKKYYTWTCFCMQFVIPSMIVLYSYSRIIQTLNCRLERNLKKGWSVLVKKRIRKIRATYRINRMLILMVACFMICYLPMNVFTIIMEAEPSVLQGRYTLAVYLVVHWIAMSSAIYNPIVCITLNADFRPNRCRGRRAVQTCEANEFADYQVSNNVSLGKSLELP